MVPRNAGLPFFPAKNSQASSTPPKAKRYGLPAKRPASVYTVLLAVCTRPACGAFSLSAFSACGVNTSGA